MLPSPVLAVGVAVAWLALGAGAVSAHLQGYGFAYADQPTSPSYTASLLYSYNDGGGDITITRSSPGAYSVSFDGLDVVGSDGGSVQVTSTDPGSRYCNVSSWGSSSVSVRCYDLLGNLADGRFNVLMLRPGPEDSDYAFAWVSNATSSTSTPSPFYLYNPGAGGSATVTRHRVGQYSIVFDDLETIGAGPRIDLVTAYGTNARCQVDGTFNGGFNVRCRSPLGFAMDARFTALSMRTQLDDEGWGFANVQDPYSLGYTLINDVGHNAGLPDDPTVTHPATGVWELDWPGLDTVGINLGSVQVSPDGFFDRQCGVDPEGGDSVTVRCFDHAGLPAETQFQVLFLKPPFKAFARDFSFAFANDNLSGPFPYNPPSGNARNPIGSGTIEINRVATGTYEVEFVGTDEWPGDGHVQVSAMGFTSNHCNVETSYGEWAEIRCFNRLGSLTNTNFNVLQVKPSLAEDTIAYARADLPFTASYTPNVLHSRNPGGGPITVTRSSTGVYAVDFDGFSALGSGGGHPQVSAFGLNNGRCQVSSWGFENVNVRCFNVLGTPADLAFNVMMTRADLNDEALAYVWSTQASLASFTPSTLYAYQTGNGPVAGTRTTTGRYTITFDGFGEQGLGTGMPIVTTYGSQEGVCNPYFWGGTSVGVACFDASGVAVDRRFNLLFVKDFNNTVLEGTYVPAPEPGFAIGALLGALGLAGLRRRDERAGPSARRRPLTPAALHRRSGAVRSLRQHFTAREPVLLDLA
ncbi:MAG: hypothetical protein AAGC67_18675 [Myxococcota bacterium]